MIFEKQMETMYRRNLFARQDNADGIFYFQPEDFPGLSAHPYSFRAIAGHELKGYFYHYENPIPGRLVVFDHGMGNGHRAYMREIERLCRAGFLVFSYDHTGCMESGGEGTNGFATSLSDLDACFRALKAEQTLRDRRFSVVGHSWGGFSTMNISALHPEITHVVSMSGFVSVNRIVSQFFGGPLKGFRKMAMDLERRSNPEYVDFCAVDTLSKAQGKVLLIYSDDDATVSRKVHFEFLKEKLGEKENITFLLVTGKDHNPGYTRDAVVYKNGFFKTFTKKRKKLTTPETRKAFMDGYDWWRMTEQDEDVWKVIENHLKSE